MVREDGKRNFVLRTRDGEESSVFSGSMPRQAALKAARRLEPHGSEEEAKEHATEIRLREKGTDKVHIFDAWAWESTAPEDKPDWMEDRDSITKGNVSKRGIEHLVADVHSGDGEFVLVEVDVDVVVLSVLVLGTTRTELLFPNHRGVLCPPFATGRT